MKELGNDIALLDTRQSGYEAITAAYLVASPRPCLVETGTATSAPHVISALRNFGLGADDLASIVVTHIHLDHAGGIGHLAEAFPNATIYVHEKGAKHVIDPSRLVASARRVFGEAMELLGEMKPTRPENVKALTDEVLIDLGAGRRLEHFAAPGHASHHIGLQDTGSGALFVGDAAGVYIPETADVRPATAPPEFDFQLATQTLTRFKERKPSRLLFSHYGPVDEVDDVLDRSQYELERLIADVKVARSEHLELDHAVADILKKTNERLQSLGAHPEVLARFEALNSTAANIVGVNRWLNSIEGTDYSFGDAAG